MPISALSAGVVRALGSSQVLTTPVSVVKELVDNALDARASSISIEISANTLDCIHVKDNGHGIVPEDRDHVALRHWTSKIRDLAELRTLGGKSLGFRGQALASAAEMAAGVEIVTRIEGEMTACKLVLGRLGQVLSRENASHGVGTSVRVTKFLHQIPVRKDIALKAAAKTLLQIKETLVAYALARPAVRISLRVIKAKNEKANWIYAPRKDASMEDAARCIFGKETAAQCMLVSWPLDSPVSPQVHTGTDADPEALSFCAHRFHVEAFLPKPSAELSKISGKGTFVSIDSRPVSSKKVAVRSFVTLYRDYVRVALADNASSSKIKDPLLCLNIFCPSGSYDANVEAAKDDVLFEDLKGVQDFLEAFFSSIYGVLEKRRSLENGKSLKSPPKSNAFDLLLAKKRPLQEPGRRDDAEEPSLFCSDDEAFPGLNTGDRQVAKGPKVPLSPPTSQADPSSYRAPHNGFPGSASRPRWRSNMYGDDDNDEDGDEGPLLRAGPPTQHGFRTNQARPPRQDRTGHAYNNDNSTASVNDMERTWFDIGSPKRKLSPERVQKRSIEEILLPQPANQHENGSSKKIASQAPDELPILALPGTRQTEKNEGGRGPAPSFAVGDPRAYLLRTMRMSSAIAAGEAASSRQRLSLLPLETSPSRSSRLQSARLVICTTPHQVEESLHKVGLWDRYVQEGALGTVDFMKETDLGVLESRLSSLVNKVYRSEEEGRLEDASAALSGLLLTTFPSTRLHRILYLSLRFNTFNVIQGDPAIDSLLPHSTPNFAGSGVRSQTLSGALPTIDIAYPDSTIKSFDIQSLYYGCAIVSQSQAAIIGAVGCTIQVTGVKADAGETLEPKLLNFAPPSVAGTGVSTQVTVLFASFSDLTALSQLTLEIVLSSIPEAQQQTTVYFIDDELRVEEVDGPLSFRSRSMASYEGPGSYEGEGQRWMNMAMAMEKPNRGRGWSLTALPYYLHDFTKRAGRKRDGEKQTSTSRDGGGGAGAKAQVRKAAFESSKKREVGVSDLTLISKISNEAINDNLKMRFEAAQIYTYIGHVLVSVNPFRDLGIYTDATLASYRGKNRLEVSPHVFAIAESAYYNMKAYQENQCVIISGESGAGKTEAAKRIMQYIANVSEGKDSSIREIKDMVLATNPLLESFGNAKTLRNNNSSRFGKYLELQFNAQGEPVGAAITNYLLEKSRVVGQIKNERNFHIFYQFAKSAPQQYRETFGVQQPKDYVYTSRSNCLDVPGMDDVADFKDTLNAMKVIGLAQAEQDDIFRMLSAVLWLGNVQFQENQEGNAVIADASVVDFLAYLLEVESGQVNRALTLRVVETSRGGRRGSVYDVPLNCTQALAVRDAFAKAIYNNLFDWIVVRVNASLKARGELAHSIGILDIYGFEIFERNSFEQLCINYVNEKLQQIFIQLTLKKEQEEYAREQIQWTPINYFDNKVVCELIEEKRPPGIFAALNDACATAHADSGAADQTFVQRLNMLSSNAHFQPRQGQFIIKHYAGDVSYAVEGMTDKNKDQLLKDLLNLVAASQNSFVRKIFPDQVDQDSKRRPPTAGDKIKASATDLVATLMRSSPSYIRTIKPNDNKSPAEYNSGNVLHQIKYLGLQENVRIRRAGFAYRQTFEKFVERFYLLSPHTSYAGDYTWAGDALSGTKQIFKDTGIPADEYQMGVTKAFIKTPETLFALEHMRDRYWHNMATRIQRAWRRYVRYRVECATRIQKFWRKKRGGLEYIQLRDYGHTMLQGRKERRRFSLLGSRRFMGDYLGVDASIGSGAMIRRSVGIPGKPGYPSHELVQRTIAKTNKHIYIIVYELVNGQLSVSAERTIPISAIKYISTSTCRDDWFAIGVGSPQEPDPLMSCVLKTEFFVQLKQLTRGALNLKISESIEYNKKPGKPAQVKVIKEANPPREDVYKSGAIHTGRGEPPNSVSRPTPRSRQVASKPTKSGKVVRPDGPKAVVPARLPAAQPKQSRPIAPSLPPSSSASRTDSGPPTTRTTTLQTISPAAAPAAAGGTSAGTAAAAAAAAAAARPTPRPGSSSTAAHTRTGSTTTSTRAPPPAPPPPPTPAPSHKDPTYRALYDFDGQSPGELSIKKDEVVMVLQKENNGWCLAKKLHSAAQGWAPVAYLKEEAARPAPPPAPPAPPSSAARVVPLPPLDVSQTNGSPAAAGRTAAKPAAPAPPAKRPVSRKPAVPPSATPRDSGVSLTSVNGGGAANGSGRNTTSSSSNASLAGGLAEALRQRQSAMQGRKEEEDEW
ncbi:MAG: class II myosin [Phylliscum demangeonii]|nr:MAG: class II myosin [Phylliscum demangeonii]